MKWNKISKSINSEGTTIIYKCDELPGITIESRKRIILKSSLATESEERNENR